MKATALSVQEFKLFRVSLGITALAALVFMPLHRVFASPEAYPQLWWLYGWCLVYSAALFRAIRIERLRLGVTLFVLIHWATDTLALMIQPLAFRSLSFLLVYTFVLTFSIMLAAWPEILALNGLLVVSAAAFMLLPATGFADSVRLYHVNPWFVASGVMIFFVLIAALGTALVEVKRRTESRLRYLNENLNRMVEEKVAEIERANRDARQYQEQVEKILRYSPVGVVITDENLGLLYTNGVHFRAENTSAAVEAFGAPLPLPALHEMLLEARTKANLQGEENLIGQRLEFTAADGVQRVLHYSFLRVKLWGELGEVTRLVLITEDITREENLRRKLVHSDQLASMGKLAANLAHEIHNPLSVIKIYVDFLEQSGYPLEKRKEAFEAIKNNITRVNRLIKSILSFARQEKPKKELVDVAAVLKNTLEMTTHFKRFRNLSIRTEIEPDLPLVLADQHRLSQVFVNLLSNARDAVGETDGDLFVGCRREGEDLLVEFRDTGKGIKECDLPNIFTPFFTTKGPGQGTGLGLSISYGIIQEHGGSIDVESREGHGSTFTVRLPFTTAQSQPLPQPDPDPNPARDHEA